MNTAKESFLRKVTEYANFLEYDNHEEEEVLTFVNSGLAHFDNTPQFYDSFPDDILDDIFCLHYILNDPLADAATGGKDERIVKLIRTCRRVNPELTLVSLFLARSLNCLNFDPVMEDLEAA